MARRGLNDVFKRLESAGFEFEEQVDGDRVILIIVLPRTKVRCRYFVEQNMFELEQRRLEGKQPIDFIHAFSADLQMLRESLE